ncbi:hypothetical protein BJ878DRAFT_525455 [Calycina marina]|uniref:Uncharacterized protein n=1 Tax=Calycina marina TaxID=1763456 RepID=A0A9P8CB61_9HELO|nr:hypothetical protein BJ878DRAFT_525455 [Calycina marina]
MYGGKVVALKIDPRHASAAERNVANAGFTDVVELRLGPALETLEKMIAEEDEGYDMVFIYANKQNNLGYFEAAL